MNEVYGYFQWYMDSTNGLQGPLDFTASGCGNFNSRLVATAHLYLKASISLRTGRGPDERHTIWIYDASARISRGTTFIAIICSRSQVIQHQRFLVRMRIKRGSLVTS